MGAARRRRKHLPDTCGGNTMNLTPEQLEAIAYIVLAFTGPPSLAYFLVKGLFR
ncbi:hypothetical protein Ritam007_66 [Mycobacterium phage Ritam007]|nr:hypothetical protein Saroj_66 [Mycobacterium phage Saroj]UZV39592.1 hypothetical protein Ritam007_66 [Mycobacterium phage Ritam007]